MCVPGEQAGEKVQLALIKRRISFPLPSKARSTHGFAWSEKAFFANLLAACLLAVVCERIYLYRMKFPSEPADH